mgnify:CR=1 FL=1
MKSPEFEELTEREKELIDNLFPHYLFYKTLPNGDREFRCSHCRQRFIKSHIARTSSYEDRELMHVRHGDLRCCPLCGAVTTVKNLGKSKQRKNLWHREKVVVIHAVNHDRVEARCYFAEKDYKYSLAPKTELTEKSRYLLAPGKAIKFKAQNYSGEFYNTNTVGKPFPSTAMYYGTDKGYTVFGLNRLKNTFLKYNQLDSFISYDAQHYSGSIYNGPMMPYLSYFAMYPQLEMLQKLGHYDVVRELINRGRKSFPYTNWKAKNITDFFKMSKQEYNAFKENGGTLGLLRAAHSIRFGEERLDFAKAKKCLDCFGNEYNIKRFAGEVKKTGISLDEAFKYVLKNEDYFEYTDYLQMADALGYDLKVHNVAFPKNFKEAHDNAAAAERVMLEEKRAAENRKKEIAAEKYLKKYEKQYSFTDGTYSIIIPHTIKEIVDEGKAMKHCVGGYAGRHMEGTLAILFLRLTAEPNKSLYTIEMHDKALTQVQGYNNRTPLTPEAKAFFDMWLAWVNGGSKKTKSGESISASKTTTKTA